MQDNIDLFANISSEANLSSSFSGNKIDNTFDPFAAISLNNFDAHNSGSNQTAETKFEFGTESPEKHKTNDSSFQVKSGIWADSLNRGLIDLDITARKFLISSQHC